MKENRSGSYNPEKYRVWYEANKEKKLAYASAYYAENRAAKIDYAKTHREKNPRNWVKSHLKRLYGIDESIVSAMRSKQNNKCAICAVEFSEETKQLKPHIDHDHVTFKVRGLLCGACNVSLGHLERAGFLEAAMKYLGNA